MNCGEINGVYDCRKKASGNDPKYTQKDAKKEVTEDVKIDGSKVTDTTTTTTTTTCSGVGACSTTNTTNKNSNVTNADGSSGGESGSCTGDNCGKGDADGNGVPDGEEGQEEEGGSPDVNEFPKPGEKGNFDDTSADFDTKIEALKTELGTKAQEMGDLFGLAGDLSLGSGGGDLYCDGSVEILGQTIDFCLDDYRNQLNYIALAVLFVCALVSLFIVFR
ncbi:MAG: hypothetical protein CML01_00520 [Pseudomonas sp.]|nr:hypothetical protein [Pseudomonas sp.]